MATQIQRLRAYIELMRLDKPVGILLLLWPCWWGVALSSPEEPAFKLLWLFAVGAIAMRSAGCIVNDIADRKIDAQVERTRMRPLASGRVGIIDAVIIISQLLAVALAVVLQLHPTLLYLAAGSLLLVAAYPFMKRITFWPQAFLGITFNLGALFGWIAASGALHWPALALYIAGICWTIGYDTIYAHQDIEDDMKIGVKSTAIRFGENTRRWVGGFYAASALALLIAIIGAGGGLFAYGAFALATMHFHWQLNQFQSADPALALRLFKSNATLGGVIAALLLIDRSAASLLAY